MKKSLYFLKEPESKSSSESKEKKRKSPDAEIFDDDEDFESMMQDIDFDEEIGESYSVFKFKLIIVMLFWY
jgi:hypothetical protein